MTFAIRYDTPDPFKLSQTTILDFDINDGNFLVINIEKLRWNY